MPIIVDYPVVLETLVGQGLQCNYHNSGSFGFAPSAPTEIRGWIIGADPTIRPQMLNRMRDVVPASEQTLAGLAVQFWREHLPGRAWVMPGSHWSYELNFGGPDWLPVLLADIGIDPAGLLSRNNAAALEFSPVETGAFQRLTQGLLERLRSSDFVVAFPGRAVLCTVHHHKQLWWVSSDGGLIEKLDLLVPAGG